MLCLIPEKLEKKMQGKEILKHIKNRFKINKLFLYETLNLFNIFFISSIKD